MTVEALGRSIRHSPLAAIFRRAKSPLIIAGLAALLALLVSSANVSPQSSFSVVSLSFQGTPNGDVYVTGDQISIQVEFSAMPDCCNTTYRPTLKVQIGSNERTFNGGFDGEVAYFRYTVTDSDLDTDGVSVAANSLDGNVVVDGDTIDLDTLTHDALDGGQAHRVSHPQPTIDSIAFDTTPSGDVYEAGDTIEVKLGFSANVSRESSDPLKLNLKVGDNDRPMRASYSGSEVTFSYTTKTSDYDTDGVSVDADSLTGKLKVGSVTFDASEIDHDALDGGTTHLVNRAPPTVESIAFDSTPADTLYLTGETIEVEVEFSETIGEDSSDPLTLDLQVGSNTRAMSASIDDDTATFSYTVTNADSDVDGVSVAADSLDGTIVVDSISLAASLISHAALDGGDGHRVNPAAPTIEDMEFSSTGPYTIGDTISVEVEFDATVDGDSSDPLTLTLQIGDDQRTATGIFEGRLIYFQYTVVAADVDTDGASVVANSMSGTLVYNSISYSGSDIAVSALDGGASHKVNRAPPTVSSITITSTPTDGVYETGDRISVTVDFGENLTEPSDDRVTLQLQVGTRVRTLTGSLDGSEAYLGYRVVAEDYDIDGVSVIADSLDGTLKSGSYSWDASTLSNDAVVGGSDHIVNPNQITVEQIRFEEIPADHIYDTGEIVGIEVEFSSTPGEDSSDPIKLAVQIGDEVKSLTGGFDGESAYFRYTVTADDFDPDGVTVDANSLSGTLIVNGNRIDMTTVEHAALEGGASHLVNRPATLALESMAITSSPDGDFYVAGDVIEVTMTFNQTVHEGDDDITLILDVGGGQRSMEASFDDSATAVFSYTVLRTDLDEDGVEVRASSMSGNIAYAGGNYTRDASALTFPTVEGGQVHRVNEFKLLSVEFRDETGTQSYVTGDLIKVYTIFNGQVGVNHASPNERLTILVGDTEHEVPMKGSAPSDRDNGEFGIYFQYLVQEGDADSDGVSLPENPFSGQVYVLTQYLYEFANVVSESVNSGFRINPDADIESVEITSSPENDTGYTVGESIVVRVSFFQEVEIGDISIDQIPVLDLTLHGDGGDDDDDTRVVQAIASVESNARYEWIDFVYSIDEADLALDGISIAANSIDANGVSITLIEDEVAANLRHDAVAQDTSQPIDPRLRIVSVSFSSEPDADSFYLLDDEITVTVTFSENALLASNNPRSVPSITGLDYDEDDSTKARTFVYQSGERTNTWVFKSTVAAGDNSYNGISLDAIDADDDLNDRINSWSGADVLLTFNGLDKDSTQQAYGGPMATSVLVTSTPDSTDGYEEGEKFTFEVSFDDELLVIETDPEIDIKVGDNVRTAELISGHGYVNIDKLQFEYEFDGDDEDSDGIEILDTWFIVSGDFDRGYFLTGDPSDSSTYSQPIWKFVNPSAGTLTSHKVQSSSSSGISWLPGD
ncbi:MAG: hypothetical protein F4038_03605 [Chloroflexi bacterium]|nr:hypothetical protein [Chloroflexota bacterium]MYJ92123.1 hypothetical protein [Chloroflexota bacterium]